MPRIRSPYILSFCFLGSLAGFYAGFGKEKEAYTTLIGRWAFGRWLGGWGGL